jgi:glycerophosphoryl diester phosphodiesterase
MTFSTGPQIIAHRGFSARAPENTLAALDAAVAAGSDAVEFDVQTAACGTPVLFHDPMLGRTTNGVGPLRRRPLGLLKVLDAGSWFGPEFKDERIPTQEEALLRLAGRVQEVYQDIKGYREMEDLDRIVDITRRTGMAEASIFVSSNWVVMNRLKHVAPEIRRAYLVDTIDRLPEALDRSAVDDGSLLSLEIGLCLEQRDAVQEAKDSGVEVVTWTVNQPGDAAEALALGIRRITTDQVEDLLNWKAGLDLDPA